MSLPELTAWNFDLGVYQGRIQPVGWVAPSGQWVYQLGHELPGRFAKLSWFDSNAVTQAADFTSIPLTRFRVRLRAPKSMPAGLSWMLFVNVSSALDTLLAIDITRDRDLADLALPTVSATMNMDGADLVQFQLMLVHTGVGSGTAQVELPGVAIDALVLDATTAPVVVANRNPEPGERGVPLTSAISVDLLSTDGNGVNATLPAVWVGGVLACSGGVAQNGFGLAIDNFGDNASLRITITPSPVLAPDTDVTVRVTYPGLDESYTFSTVDTVGPQVTGALATSERTVRVSFDEPLSGPGAAGDYVLALVSGAPAVTPVVTAATADAGGAVLLTLDAELTAGAVYRVTAIGVTDLLGNAVAALHDSATFSGYACPAVPGRDFALYRMLLEYDRRQDESGELAAFVGCYQDVTDLLLCKIDRFLEIIDPDTAPEAWLDLMLQDLGSPFSFDLSEIDKRRLVQVLVAIYQQKGTDLGIINAIRFFLGIEVTISVPAQTGGLIGKATLGGTLVLGSGNVADLYSYVINAPIALSDDQRQRITIIARYMQRAACHLLRIAEPAPPPAVPNHIVLGLSHIGQNTLLHSP